MARRQFGVLVGIIALAGSSPVPSALNMIFQSIIAFTKNWVLESGIKVAGILVAAWIIVFVGRIIISRIVYRSVGKKRAPTIIKVLSSTKSFAIWVIAILMILPEFGINPTPLLAGAGLVGLAIGMGAKNLIQDYISGLFILFGDQFRMGEKVKVAGIEGEVEGFDLRQTTIKSKEGQIYYIPNGQITIVSNLSRG